MLEFAVSRAERKAVRTLMVVWKMYCPAHSANEVSYGVGGVVQWPV